MGGEGGWVGEGGVGGGGGWIGGDWCWVCCGGRGLVIGEGLLCFCWSEKKIIC